MNWRTARVIIGVLAVVCLGLVASVVVPLSMSTPHAALPPDEQFSVGDHETFRVDTQFTVDGETEIALDGATTPDGPQYMRLQFGSDSVVETYQAGPNATVYERFTLHREEGIDARRSSFESDTDRELIRETETDAGTVFVVRTDYSVDFVAELSNAALLSVNSLQYTAYERVDDPDSNGRSAVYEPQGGWFDGASTYRVTNTSGQVRVDTETGAVQSATVSWGLTEPADTYAHTRLARLFGDQPQRFEVDYEFETEVSNVSRPDWVPRDASAVSR